MEAQGLPSVDDEELIVEDLPMDLDLRVAETARSLVLGAVVLDDMVLGDRTGLGDDEEVAQLVVVLGETKRARVFVPALARTLTVERLVRPAIVLTEVVIQAELEGAALGIDIGGAVEGTQDVRHGGPVEALHLSMALRVACGAMNQVDSGDARDDGEGVAGDESGTVVEIDDEHEAHLADELVEASKEELRRFARTDHDVKPLASGVVDEEKGDALASVDPGAEVFSVGQDHHHPIGVGKAPHVPLCLRGPDSGRHSHPLDGSPDRRPVDLGVGGDDLQLAGTPDELGDARTRIRGLLVAEKLDQDVVEHGGDLDAFTGPRLETREAGVSVGGQPAIEGAQSHPAKQAGYSDVILGGDGSDCPRPLLPTKLSSEHL